MTERKYESFALYSLINSSELANHPTFTEGGGEEAFESG